MPVPAALRLKVGNLVIMADRDAHGLTTVEWSNSSDELVRFDTMDREHAHELGDALADLALFLRRGA